MAFHWNCAVCTYRHAVPSDRCAMCAQPREGGPAASAAATAPTGGGGRGGGGGGGGGTGARSSSARRPPPPSSSGGIQRRRLPAPSDVGGRPLSAAGAASSAAGGPIGRGGGSSSTAASVGGGGGRDDDRGGANGGGRPRSAPPPPPAPARAAPASASAGGGVSSDRARSGVIDGGRPRSAGAAAAAAASSPATAAAVRNPYARRSAAQPQRQRPPGLGSGGSSSGPIGVAANVQQRGGGIGDGSGIGDCVANRHRRGDEEPLGQQQQRQDRQSQYRGGHPPAAAVASSSTSSTSSSSVPAAPAHNPYAQSNRPKQPRQLQQPQRQRQNQKRPTGPHASAAGTAPAAPASAPVTHVEKGDPFAIAAAAAASSSSSSQNGVSSSYRQHPYKAGPIRIDPATSHNWIYPTNKSHPIREYQLAISHTAVRYNTLVSLPTGLGKTLIAAVVMYNYHRWFGGRGAGPDDDDVGGGKVVFCAPTRPLVTQQIRACYEIMGIPASRTAEISGKTKGDARSALWRERSVFFCTPQTLQRDIEEGRCDARRIVCIVLDEAHKSRGDYAYTRVVRQIEESGARFRVVGLSATPGTDIKAIQEVIDNLRIHRIEVRLEEDENVKKYVHERHVEIIRVKQGSAVTTIERMFSETLNPLLERLRNNNALSRIRGGNATITPYCMMKAREDFHRARNGDTSMDGYFYALQHLVGIRSDLRISGVGVVRTKLFRLKSEKERANGVLGSVLRGKQFKAMYEAVVAATSGGTAESAMDLKLNNPKLEKLDEILEEHFKRKMACGGSTRAIVFSQWRDSVEEIVRMLSSNPLLKPRKFVGQSNAAAGKDKDGKSKSIGVENAGMKQHEQQEVMRQFRDGTFNVIVCTSIGEEGLDIGEVDLIVNFDSLKSPIRMIQRTGRTGRKRDGRVVSLVAEGQEEQRQKASVLATKTLGRALKNTSAFRLVKDVPLFPTDKQFPILHKKDMNVDTVYHMSQVGGHNKHVRRKNRPNVDCGSWRLTSSQEEDRKRMFGLKSSYLSVARGIDDGDPSDVVSFPDSLRRKYIRARLQSLREARGDKGPRQRVSLDLGSTSRILKIVEERFCGASRRRTGAHNQAGMDGLYPLSHPQSIDPSDEFDGDGINERPPKATLEVKKSCKKSSSTNRSRSNRSKAGALLTKVGDEVSLLSDTGLDCSVDDAGDVQIEDGRQSEFAKDYKSMSSSQSSVSRCGSAFYESDESLANMELDGETKRGTAGIETSSQQEYDRKLDDMFGFSCLSLEDAVGSSSESSMPLFGANMRHRRRVLPPPYVDAGVLSSSEAEGSDVSGEGVRESSHMFGDNGNCEDTAAVRNGTLEMFDNGHSQVAFYNMNSDEEDSSGTLDPEDKVDTEDSAVHEQGTCVPTIDLKGSLESAPDLSKREGCVQFRLPTPVSSSSESDIEDDDESAVDSALPLKPHAIIASKTKCEHFDASIANRHCSTHGRTYSQDAKKSNLFSEAPPRPHGFDINASLSEDAVHAKEPREAVSIRLPTQDSSSSDVSIRLPTQDSSSSDVSIRLPTQDSSSSDDEPSYCAGNSEDLIGKECGHFNEGTSCSIQKCSSPDISSMEELKVESVSNPFGRRSGCVEKSTRRKASGRDDHIENHVPGSESVGGKSPRPRNSVSRGACLDAFKMVASSLLNDNESSVPELSSVMELVSKRLQCSKDDIHGYETCILHELSELSRELAMRSNTCSIRHRAQTPKPQPCTLAPRSSPIDAISFDQSMQESPIVPARRTKSRRKNILMTQGSSPGESTAEGSSKQAIALQQQQVAVAGQHGLIKRLNGKDCRDNDDASSDMVCALCHCADSPEDDPIVFCDGPRCDYSCTTMVHKSCYQIPGSLDQIESWRCDPCEEKHLLLTGSANSSLSSVGPASCGICSQEGGVLKRTPQPEGRWVHPVCMYWTPEYAAHRANFEQSDTKPCIRRMCGDIILKISDLQNLAPNRLEMRCNICSSLGWPVNCAAPDCSHAAHPHCAMNATSGDERWMLVHSLEVNAVGGESKYVSSIFCYQHIDIAAEFIEREGSHANELFGGFVSLKKRTQTSPKVRMEVLSARKGPCDLVDSSEDETGHSRHKNKRLKRRKVDEFSREKRRTKLEKNNERRQKRGAHKCIFLDTEAGIASDTDVDGDAEEDRIVREMEDESCDSMSSFINDTSQLGFSQDALGLVDYTHASDDIQASGDLGGSVAMHRALDNEREASKLFTTPLLNRQMMKKAAGRTPNTESDDWRSRSSSRKSGSLSGLGNMCFIRSVIEHHKLGGSATEIESEYHRIAGQGNSNTLEVDAEGHATNASVLDAAAQSRDISNGASVARKEGDGEACSSNTRTKNTIAKCPPDSGNASPVMTKVIGSSYPQGLRSDLSVKKNDFELHVGPVPADLKSSPGEFKGNSFQAEHCSRQSESSVPPSSGGTHPNAPSNRVPSEAQKANCGSLTDTQKAMIEQKRQEALRRRQQKNQKQHNPYMSRKY